MTSGTARNCLVDISCLPGGSTRREVGPGCIWDTHFEEEEVVGYHSKDRCYRLTIVITTLPLTIRPQFVSQCLRRLYQQGVGHFGAKFGEEGVDDFNTI